MKIGFIGLPVTGHLNPMIALASKLQARGHQVAFIGIPDAEPPVRAAKLDFLSYCEKEFPLGSDIYAPVAKLHGLAVVQCACQEVLPPFIKATIEHLPEKLAGAGFDLLVIDTIHFFIELVPISMGIPYVHIWNVLDNDFSGVTPPCFFDWPLETDPGAQERNLLALQTIAGSLLPSVLQIAVPQAERLGLNINWHDPSSTTSKLAVITTFPKAFDFPDVPKPQHFYYSGPFFVESAREPTPFPWEKLTGKPLVYASMGTLVNGSLQVFKTILDAVSKIPEIEVVLSVGKNTNIDDLGAIPANVIAVNRAPQLELLQQSELCITHAGLNTALEALAAGVPMVAIPVGFDQPGVAARIAHHKLGEFISIEEMLTVDRLEFLIRKVLGDSSYRQRARHFQNIIAKSDGLEVAATVIEKAYDMAVRAKLN
jgi:zeaxanthin glucosyltransferase